MTRHSVLPSRLVTLAAPGRRRFRGSMASLHAPLPTLRPAPHGTRRTAWGQCDSLGLHCSGLSPPTPCRSPDALPADRCVDRFIDARSAGVGLISRAAAPPTPCAIPVNTSLGWYDMPVRGVTAGSPVDYLSPTMERRIPLSVQGSLPIRTPDEGRRSRPPTGP